MVVELLVGFELLHGGDDVVALVFLCELEGEELPEVLGQRDSCIVARGEEQPVEQVDDEELLVFPEIGRGAFHIGGLLVDEDLVLSDLDSIGVAEVDDGVGGHDLGEAGNLPLLLLALLH